MFGKIRNTNSKSHKCNILIRTTKGESICTLFKIANFANFKMIVDRFSFRYRPKNNEGKALIESRSSGFDRGILFPASTNFTSTKVKKLITPLKIGLFVPPRNTQLMNRNRTDRLTVGRLKEVEPSYA